MKLFVVQKNYAAETYTFPSADFRALANRMAEVIESGDAAALRALVDHETNGNGEVLGVEMMRRRSRNRGCSAMRGRSILPLDGKVAQFRALAAQPEVTRTYRSARHETLLQGGFMGEGDSNWMYFKSAAAAQRWATRLNAEVRQVTGMSHSYALDFGRGTNGHPIA